MCLRHAAVPAGAKVSGARDDQCNPTPAPNEPRYLSEIAVVRHRAQFQYTVCQGGKDLGNSRHAHPSPAVCAQ